MDKILKSQNIVITIAANQSVQTIQKLEGLGARVLSFPTIKISTLLENSDTNFHVNRINEFNTLIFTSENSVRSLLNIVERLGVEFDPEAFFVISIGDKTTQICEEFGFRVDFQSVLASSENMLSELKSIDLIGRKILIPLSNLSEKKQFDELESQGATVTSVTVYENRVNDRESLATEIELLGKERFDLFIFTSPSTFKGFLNIMDINEPKNYFKDKTIAVIGPVTQRALIDQGIEPDIIPSNYSMNFLIDEIKEYYSQNSVEK